MLKYSKEVRKKRIKFLIKAGVSCCVILLVILAGVLTAQFVHISKENEKPVVKIENPFIPDEVTLVMTGDNLLHTPLIKNAEQQDGTLNFDSLYEDTLPYFQEADLSVIVQETVLGGKELGYSGYPMFNSPQEVGDSLVKAGFDIILHATNHTLDKGARGVENTLEFWKKYPQVTVLGINNSKEEYNSVRYIEKNGIKFALLNYTDSTNGMPKPSGKEYLINTVNEEKIKSDLAQAEANAEFTIVFMHWGTEYTFSETPFQQKLASMMCENGADLIMGSHPHVLEPVKWIESENGNRALVFYSLGNFVSRQKELKNLLGGIASVKITRQKDNSIVIKECSLTPTVTHYNINSRGFRVYPLKDYTDELAATHGVRQFDGAVSIKRLNEMLDLIYKDNTAVTIER